MGYFLKDLFNKSWHLFCFVYPRTFVNLPKLRKILLIYDGKGIKEGLDCG
jgi:hypothetical protein